MEFQSFQIAKMIEKGSFFDDIELFVVIFNLTKRFFQLIIKRQGYFRRRKATFKYWMNEYSAENRRAYVWEKLNFFFFASETFSPVAKLKIKHCLINIFSRNLFLFGRNTFFNSFSQRCFPFYYLFNLLQAVEGEQLLQIEKIVIVQHMKAKIVYSFCEIVVA